jgi:hypothetical protein
MAETPEERSYRSNVMRYVRGLYHPQDDETRKVLMELLAAERAKAKAAGWAPLLP